MKSGDEPLLVGNVSPGRVRRLLVCCNGKLLLPEKFDMVQIALPWWQVSGLRVVGQRDGKMNELEMISVDAINLDADGLQVSQKTRCYGLR